MRHSDIRLTLGTYTDPQLLDTASAVKALPSLTSTADGQRLKATGTFGPAGEELGAQLGGKGRAGVRCEARPRTEGSLEGETSRTLQRPVHAELSNGLHYDSSKRATGLEPATFSLEG